MAVQVDQAGDHLSAAADSRLRTRSRPGPTCSARRAGRVHQRLTSLLEIPASRPSAPTRSAARSRQTGSGSPGTSGARPGRQAEDHPAAPLSGGCPRFYTTPRDVNRTGGGVPGRRRVPVRRHRRASLRRDAHGVGAPLPPLRKARRHQSSRALPSPGVHRPRRAGGAELTRRRGRGRGADGQDLAGCVRSPPRGRAQGARPPRSHVTA